MAMGTIGHSTAVARGSIGLARLAGCALLMLSCATEQGASSVEPLMRDYPKLPLEEDLVRCIEHAKSLPPVPAGPADRKGAWAAWKEYTEFMQTNCTPDGSCPPRSDEERQHIRQIMEKCVARDPRVAMCHTMLGYLSMKQDPASARNHFLIAVQLDPDPRQAQSPCSLLASMDRPAPEIGRCNE
jgi:hypothetical protein